MKGIKWLGTLLCLTGVCLTRFNVYPYTISASLSLIGSALWTFAGWKRQDITLILHSAVAAYILYVAAIYRAFLLR